MKFNSKSSDNESNSTLEKEDCADGAQLWCVCSSNCGEDFTGMPKIKGWLRIEYPEDRLIVYIDSYRVRKLKVKGEYGRYLTYDWFLRKFHEPTAATSGTFIGGGSGNTTCTGFGNTLSCSTMGSSSMYIPGVPGSSGGYRQSKTQKFIIDCDEKTGSPDDSKLMKDKVKLTPSGNRLPEILADKYCPIINTLPKSDFMKFAK